MSESVQFWLDNKMSAGIKVAAIGDQVLVSYREKFYVVEKDAAQTRGGKTLRYSKTSLPAVWKRVLRGEVLPAEVLVVPADDALPLPTTTKRERVKKMKPQQSVDLVAQSAAPEKTEPISSTAGKAKLPVSQKKTDIKPAAQSTVVVTCPQCSFKHEIPLEKGKNGKPFFMACAKCTSDFAVRFVPVMAYQAQVAGFR